MADLSAVKEITDKFETGVKELFDSDKYRDYLTTMSRFHSYSTRNTLLIYLQLPTARRVAGYSAWKNNFNRQVKKGEHGIKIFAPIANKGKDIWVEKLDPVTKMPVLDEHGQPVMERLSATSDLQVRFKMVSVFDESQTEGDPLPELAETLTGDVERYELFMDALRAVSTLPIEFAPLDDGMDGRCIFGDKIEIREGMSQIQTVCAVIHELGHSRLHDLTVIKDEEPPKDRRQQECEAESLSFCVCNFFGIETGANSFGYIAEYARSKEMKELYASLDAIRKASAALIGEISDKYQALAKERGIDLSTTSEAVEVVENVESLPEPPDVSGKTETTLKEETQTVEYTAFQKKNFTIADGFAHLPLQDRLNIIAETFGCKTASVETSPCTGKWRGTSDISVRLDNGASLFIGNRQTPEAKKQTTISQCVNNALSQYNPQTVTEAKRNAYIALLEQERKDNAAAEQRGLKPYKVLTVEMNDGRDAKTGGYIGWYYVMLDVGGRIFGHLTSNLNSDISRGVVGEDYGKRSYYVAGGLGKFDVDYVFDNVGHSTLDGAYKMELTPAVLEPAKEALARRERFGDALAGMKAVEDKPVQTAEHRLYDKLSELFPDFMSGKYSYLKLESPGMEPLSLEWIFGDRISVMHTFVQEGDLCYDPMIEFIVNSEKRTLTASAFQQSIPPLYQYHDDDGVGRSVDGNGNERAETNLREQLHDFSKQWFKNIEEQGYMPVVGTLVRGDDDEIRVEFDKDGNLIIPDLPVRQAGEMPYDEAAWHDLADIEDDDLREAKRTEINELLSGGKSYETTKTPEPPQTIDLALPDPAWTVAELAEYGYTEPDMFPLSVGRAAELFDTGHTIYLLYPDNTETVAFDRDEIITFSSNGFCGITKTDWELSPVRDAQNRVYENIIINREQIENSKESELIHNGESMFGIYQIRNDIDAARDFRFAPMRELEAHDLAVDRANYELVYSAPLPQRFYHGILNDTDRTLKTLYAQFNNSLPPDYTARSVSVSDVIVLQQGGEVTAHYVDSAGFKGLPAFTGNEREQNPALYQIDTSSQPAKEGAKSAMAVNAATQKSATKTPPPTLMEQLAEAKKIAVRGSQPTAKQNEREV
jgi:hypothetical protein